VYVGISAQGYQSCIDSEQAGGRGRDHASASDVLEPALLVKPDIVVRQLLKSRTWKSMDVGWAEERFFKPAMIPYSPC
jgi:hypothetical protein